MVKHTDIHSLLGRMFEIAQDAIVASPSVILLGVTASALWALGRVAFVESCPPAGSIRLHFRDVLRPRS